MEEINLTLDSYNFKEAKAAVVRKLIEDKPTITIEGAAKELGISLRTLHRFICGKKDIKLFFKKKVVKSKNNERVYL